MTTKIKKPSEPKTGKWEVKYEDEYTISVWKYNSKISTTNPYETTVQYKNDGEEKKRTRTKKTKV